MIKMILAAFLILQTRDFRKINTLKNDFQCYDLAQY